LTSDEGEEEVGMWLEEWLAIRLGEDGWELDLEFTISSIKRSTCQEDIVEVVDGVEIVGEDVDDVDWKVEELHFGLVSL
jgi:hypothetical protein